MKTVGTIVYNKGLGRGGGGEGLDLPIMAAESFETSRDGGGALDSWC